MTKPLLLSLTVFLACRSLSLAQSPTPSASASPSPSPEHYRLRVSAGIAEALVRHKVAPVYPEEAKFKHITGDVVLHFVFDTRGNVTDVLSMEGDPILAKAAAEALRQWKFKPYMLNGKPVEVESVTTIHFRM